MVTLLRHFFYFCFFIIQLESCSSKEGIVKDDNLRNWFKTAFTLNGTGQQWKDPSRDSPTSNFSSTCGTGKDGDTWLITNHVLLKETFSDVIHVDVDVVFSLCDGRGGNKTGCFSNYFEVYVYRGRTAPNIPTGDRIKTKNFLLKSFSPLYNITNTTLPNTIIRRQNETYYFNRNKTEGVTFGIRSRGACGSIFRMKMYYYYCEEIFINSVKFVTTGSLANESKPVNGTCSKNSSPSGNETSLVGYCYSKGTWNTSDNVKCLCNHGYEPTEKDGCLACRENYIKTSVSNDMCLRCPSNNVDIQNRTRCECEDGYYKPSAELGLLTPCYVLLKLGGLTQTKRIADGRVNITWKEPTKDDALNDTVLYDVECYSCEQNFCNVSCTGETYDPRQVNLTQPYVLVSNLQSGRHYKFRIYPKNSLNDEIDRAKWNFTVVMYHHEIISPSDPSSSDGNDKLYYIIFPVLVVVVVILVLFTVIFILRRRGNEKKIALGAYTNPGVELPPVGQRLYVDPTDYDNLEDAVSEFANELDRSSVLLETFVGGGEFGDVYKAVMTTKDGEKVPVAIKTLKHDAPPKAEKDFLLEASVMGQFNNPNVVRLEGVVTKSKPRMIVLEFMSNGSLDNFLKAKDGMLTQLQLIGMARGVSAGMVYLSGINFVHRDLAARNVLLNDSLLCKISDFGLSRELEETESSRGEYATSGGRIPVRWTAPEAIKYRKFSSASDVWSFGILMWEIMSFADRPYGDWDNFKVLEQLDAGYRLPAPPKCPRAVSDLMQLCWREDRSKRPEFTEILAVIDQWIRSPETLDKEVHVISTLREWLNSIKMANYAPRFLAAGYRKSSDIVDLTEEDLKEMGITLIGHRNKILKGIGSLQLKNQRASLAV